MTVPASPRRAGPFDGTGAQTAFPFSFKVFSETDVRVVELDVPTSVESDAVLTSEYTVAVNPDQESTPGGTVNYLVAPSSDTKVTLIGDLDFEQPTDLPDGGQYRAQQVEDALDRLSMLMQQLKEITDRCAKVPVSAEDTEDLFESINVLAANLTVLQTVVSNIDALVTLATSIDDVSILAALDTEIALLASIAAQIVTVAGIASAVTDVAAIDADIVAVNAISAQIVVLAANIGTIASKANAGANSDITSLSGLTTPLSVPQGGTGTNDGGRLRYVGEVFLHAANTPPPGALKANGAAVSRTAYAALFARIGTTYGVGDGSTTFNLPDARGEFFRGWDDGRGIDSGRAIGSAQAQAIQSHTHSASTYDADSGASGFMFAGSAPVAGTWTSDPTGGPETRPRNLALLACIQYL